VAVHDGVRPLVSPDLIRRSYEEAERFGSAVTAVPLKDSLRKIDPEGQTTPADREAFRLVQTPQTFRIDWMRAAFDTEYDPFFTDCASVLEHGGFPVHLIEGNYQNLKITTPEDLLVAEAFLKAPRGH
jgi:2-C-methyl-D-erythritol 4-phosphate cytidylyltransferase